MYGLAHSLETLPATWKRAKSSDDMIQFIIIGRLGVYSHVWEPDNNENRVARFESSVGC